MPPYGHQALLRANHTSLERSLEFLRQSRQMAEDLIGDWVSICDPVPLSVVKVSDIERAQMLIESESRPALHQFMDQWLARLYAYKTSVRWFLEVDPTEL